MSALYRPTGTHSDALLGRAKLVESMREHPDMIERFFQAYEEYDKGPEGAPYVDRKSMWKVDR